MYPTFKHMILAHPLPFFLFWLPSVLYFGIPINRDWYSLEPGVQLTAAAVFCLWAVLTVIALPKVWWHLYQKRKHTDPEERRSKRRTRRKLFLILSASGGLAFSLRWLSEQSYEAYPDPTLYLSLAAAFIVLLMMLKIISRFRSKAAAKPFAVKWCLPVPKQSARAGSAVLPDYCRQLLANVSQQPKKAA
jgi:uncharacterized membrane protein